MSAPQGPCQDCSRLLWGPQWDQGADLTIGVLPALREEASRQFGVLEADADHRVVGFQEKPVEPQPLPGDPGHCLASTGIYVAAAGPTYEDLRRYEPVGGAG